MDIVQKLPCELHESLQTPYIQKELICLLALQTFPEQILDKKMILLKIENLLNKKKN